MMETIYSTALETIKIEAEAISGLAAHITAEFEKVVTEIAVCSGRVIITGVGKSGIVAQKISATLNSTGTPSLFMHAGDAIHGDLGMVQKNDIVLLVSKSGESAEIKVLVPILKNFGNVLIGMGGNPQSFLAMNSAFFINTAVSQEACPHNLAPTSSTTAQMVMGDVLAVCLMKASGFQGDDFAKLHPGGNLGKRLFLKVKDVCLYNAKPSVTEDAGLRSIIVEITKGRLGATAVLDGNGKISGIITDGDLRRMLEKSISLESKSAPDILSKNPKTIFYQDLAVNALEVLRSNNINQLLIVNETGEYVGMLHIHDLVKEGIV